MNRAVLLIALLFGMSAANAAPAAMRPVHLRPMQVVVLPDSATTLFVRHSVRLTPAGRAWVASQSQRLRSGALDPSLVEGEAGRSCGAAFVGACKIGDIEALAFLVLMQATSDMDQDLQQIMAEVKAQNAAKAHQRAVLQAMRRQRALTAAEINQDTDSIKHDLDSISEMGEMESLRLQMLMDRRSKFISTLSNIMKKIGTTQESTTQNLK
jgi:hypothetical protein